MNLKFAFVAIAALGGVALSSATASAAMPNGLPSAAADQTAVVDQVRYVCNEWGRCWWRPNYYAPRYYAPRHYYGPRMHHRHWGHRHYGHRHYGHRHWGHRHGHRW